jgi:Transglutaminase-like superfamily
MLEALFRTGYWSNPLVRKIRRAAYLTPSDWRYLAIALAELLAARIRLSTVAAEKILQELQAPLSALPHQQGRPLKNIDVERLSWAIATVAQYVPWRSDCFVRVIAADRWLRRHHLRPDFYLGVAKDEQGVFAAHAWLRYGDLTVTGGRYDRFSALIEPAVK